MIHAFGLTDTGCERELNEDRVLLDSASSLYAVADGMGGQRSGERAAEIAVQCVRNYFQATAGRKEMTWPFGYDANLPFSQNIMATAIRLANRRVWRESESIPEYTGMGTTLVAVYLKDAKATIGSVGDSRVYHYRGKSLRVLTRDDSLIARLIESGAITLAEAASHPMRSVLTEAAGAKETINVQTRDIDLLTGDRLILTSDGVHAVIDELSLRQILDRGDNPKTTVERIVAESRECGGPDNISCIILEYQDGKERVA